MYSRSFLGCVVVLLAVSSVALMGCEPKRTTPAPTDTKAKAEGPADANKTTSTAPAGAEACKKYAEAVCTELKDPKSATCMAMKDVSDIMAPEACQVGLDKMDFTKTQIAAMAGKCDELVKKLCADIGPETATCKMVEGRTKQFPPDRCKMMLSTETYPQVLAQLKAEEAKNKPLSAEDWNAIASAETAASFGPADAKVTLVEFSDFQCPYCGRAAASIDELKKEFKGKSVRVVFRHFPLSFHKDAPLASQASLAAKEQGKFWEYHDVLFKNMKALKRADLEKYAKDLGLDMAKFKKALDDGTYKKRVDDDIALGTKVAVQGTPTVFLNGKRTQADPKILSQQINDLLK